MASVRYSKTTSAFMVAKGALAPGVVGFLLMSEFVGTGTFLGLPQQAYTSGMFASMAVISVAIGFFFYAFIMAPKYNESGEITISGLMQSRYGKGARLAASLIMIVALLIDTVSNYTGGAVALGSVLHVSVKPASFVLAALVSVIVAMGGLRGIGLSNIVHIIVKYAALAVVAGEAFLLLRGNSTAQARIPHELYTVQGTGAMALVTYTVANVGAVFATQYVLQSIGSLKDRKQSLRASLIASAALVPAGLLGAYIGVAARGLFPHINSVDVVPQVMDQLSPAWAGFVTAGIIAAAMVSLCALVIGATTLFIKDFYRPRKAGDKPERELRATRIAAVVLGLLPLPFAWFVPHILDVVFFSRALRASLGVMAVFAFYLPNASRGRGVVAGLLCSLVATCTWYALGDPFGVDNTYIAAGIPIVAMLIDCVVIRLRGRRNAPAGLSLSDQSTEVPS
jgi:SSS family solute:Na+ symporter